jgi:hypothetical protein
MCKEQFVRYKQSKKIILDFTIRFKNSTKIHFRAESCDHFLTCFFLKWNRDTQYHRFEKKLFVSYRRAVYFYQNRLRRKIRTVDFNN